jgi:1-acyl-sn-glycerol-3-phosphate acyltransferase
MIKADHKNWARFIFSIYIDRILKKNFSHFFIVNEVPELPSGKSVLVTPNHISWWDGFFIDYLNRIFFKRNTYAMMLETQLKKYLILSKIGAYSIDPAGPKEINASLNYTGNLLLNKRNLVVFYPEGDLKPFDTKIEPLRKGIQKLSKHAVDSFEILTAAFKISFYNERLPEIYAYFGPLIDSDYLKNNYLKFEKIFTNNIQSVQQASLNRSFKEDLFK